MRHAEAWIAVAGDESSVSYPVGIWCYMQMNLANWKSDAVDSADLRLGRDMVLGK